MLEGLNLENKYIHTHKSEKAHTCKICGKTFTGSDHLKRHISTHTGQKEQTNKDLLYQI